MMKLSELIELLTDRFNEVGECEVRLMTQEKWPFECEILGVTDTRSIDASKAESFYDADTPIVFIVEAGQCGYGDPDTWDVIRNANGLASDL
ncbi:MAG: hypothetical protein AAFV88_05560 [Planctomycetota bacterium]